MADFCNQCAEELDFPPGDMAGMCDRNECVAALCEECGDIRVDADGFCLGTSPPSEESTHSCGFFDFKKFHPVHGPRMRCGCYTSGPPCSVAHAVLMTSRNDYGND